MVKVGDTVRTVGPVAFYYGIPAGAVGVVVAVRTNTILAVFEGYENGEEVALWEDEYVLIASQPVKLSDVRIGDKVRWTTGDSEDRVISEFVVKVMNEYGAYGRESVAYAGRPWAEEGQGVLEIIERGTDD